MELLRVTKTIFTLSVPCFHKSAKVSVMNEPYKRQNNSDLLLMDVEKSCEKERSVKQKWI